MHVEDSLGYWLISAARYFASSIDQVLESHCIARGKPCVITPPQWGVIVELAAQDGQTIGALAQKLGVDGPAITNLVKRIEQSGLVKRTRSREDERVVEVWLTQEARDLFRVLDPVVEQFQESLLSPDQRRQLIDLLQQLIGGLSVTATDDRDRYFSLRAYVRRKVHERGDNPPCSTGEGGTTHDASGPAPHV